MGRLQCARLQGPGGRPMRWRAVVAQAGHARFLGVAGARKATSLALEGDGVAFGSMLIVGGHRAPDDDDDLGEGRLQTLDLAAKVACSASTGWRWRSAPLRRPRTGNTCQLLRWRPDPHNWRRSDDADVRFLALGLGDVDLDLLPFIQRL